MECKHERYYSVNCVLYCEKCGIRLPDGWKPETKEPAPVEVAETPKPARKKGGKK